MIVADWDGRITMRATRLMRATLPGVAIALLALDVALAASKLTPKEIQTEFFDGKTFTAATTSGTKFKMTFTADGKITREPQDRAGAKGEGTWKLSKDGFCTSWKGSAAICYTLVNVDKNKWSVVKGATTVAVWSK
jgi:hypothetical protein